MNALGIVFSNIHDKEIRELTQKRTLASVPFGGRFRLIDFVLSNMVNSGITDVGVITKRNYQSLMDHVGSGKYWDLSRKKGGLMVLPPYGTSSNTLYSSRFEAVKNIESFIKRSDAKYIVMSDCDNICNFDFTDMLTYHEVKNADVTLVYRKKDVESGDTKRRTIIDMDKTGKVTKVITKDKCSGTINLLTYMIIINRQFLLNILDTADEQRITSFTKDIFANADLYRVYAYEHKGYFATIDSMTNYYKHSMELLDKENRNQLFDNNGSKIYTKIRDSAPLKVSNDAKVSNSLIADGCIIEGEVKNSILFRGVKVSKGAVVTNSIVFQDTIISQDSSLHCVIADKQATILEKRHLSGHETQPYFIGKGVVI